jgi:glutamyl-tRNA synthetase
MTSPASGPPPIVGRLAPSPTGGLHLGHARSFFLAWLAARSAGGSIILRIEDIDTFRVRPGSAEGQVVDLRWLGLDWDAGPDVGGPGRPYVQSKRLALYQRAMERLKASELIYPCTCTRAEIERAASAPHASEEGPTYPGTCSRRSAADAETLGDRPFAWRFRVPPGSVEWEDVVLGRTELDPSRIGGDFILGRSNGAPSYHLAVVVDDAAMGVTQVIRGDDLVPSTPRQILLHRSLGYESPGFGHVPLAIGPDGRRLAKRDESIKIASLRNSGVDPRMLIGTLAVACGLERQVIPSTPQDWIQHFSWDTFPREPWVVSEAIIASLDPPRFLPEALNG